MGLLTIRCNVESEQEVIRISRILGATIITRRFSDEAFITEEPVVITISGPLIPDRSGFSSISLYRHHEIEQNGSLSYVCDTYTWSPE